MSQRDVIIGEIRGTGRFEAETVSMEAKAIALVGIDAVQEGESGIAYSIVGNASEQELMQMTTGFICALVDAVGNDMAVKMVVSAMGSLDRLDRPEGTA